MKWLSSGKNLGTKIFIQPVLINQRKGWISSLYIVGWFNLDHDIWLYNVDYIKRFNLDPKYSTLHVNCIWTFNLDPKYSTLHVDCSGRFNLDPTYLTLHCQLNWKIRSWFWILDSLLSIVSEDSTLPIRVSWWKFAPQLGPELVRNGWCT
jgi:hypothetical protein